MLSSSVGRQVRVPKRPPLLGKRRTVSSQLSALTVAADGNWSWFTPLEAVQSGNYIYFGCVTSDGRCMAHRVHASTAVVESFDLSGVLEIDDHNNPGVLVHDDGRVSFHYGIHNDSTFKYRIYDGSGAFTSSGSWTAQASRGSGQGPYSYPKPYVFPGDTTSGRVWLFHRRWTDGGGGTRTLTYRNSATLTGSSDPWSAYTDVLLESGARPYIVAYQDGDTLHVAASSAHPNEATYTTVQHFKATMSSGALTWSDSAGTTITPAFNIAATTRADDGGNVKRWVSDIGVGGDGHPRILWMKYPNNDGTAIEYWHSRWTGSAWVAHKIADSGAGLYAGEQFYHRGLRFHQGDVTRLYAGLSVSGSDHIVEMRTNDNGSSWSSHRTIASGGTSGSPLRARPVGVKNGDGRLNLLWWEGTYTSYTSYNTEIKAAA